VFNKGVLIDRHRAGGDALGFESKPVGDPSSSHTASDAENPAAA
jgi:hypothetical protein